MRSLVGLFSLSFSLSTLIGCATTQPTTQLSATTATQQKEPRLLDEKQAFVRHRILETSLAQTKEMSGYWDPAQRDCAGFIRFVYRSSVPASKTLWVDRASQPTAYLNAAELIAYNFTKTSAEFDAQSLKTGDILVFYRPAKKPEDAWHLMMLLAPPPYGPHHWLAIYHNGDRTPEGGALRVVSLEDLQSTVHTEWRPVTSNPNFQGVYRWNGWNSL